MNIKNKTTTAKPKKESLKKSGGKGGTGWLIKFFSPENIVITGIAVITSILLLVVSLTITSNKLLGRRVRAEDPEAYYTILTLVVIMLIAGYMRGEINWSYPAKLAGITLVIMLSVIFAQTVFPTVIVSAGKTEPTTIQSVAKSVRYHRSLIDAAPARDMKAREKVPSPLSRKERLQQTLAHNIVRFGPPKKIELRGANSEVEVYSNPEVGDEILWLSSEDFIAMDDSDKVRWKSAVSKPKGVRYLQGEANGPLRFKKITDTTVYVWKIRRR